MNVWVEPHDYATQLGRDGLVLWVCLGHGTDQTSSAGLDRAQAEQLITDMRAILDRTDTQ